MSETVFQYDPATHRGVLRLRREPWSGKSWFVGLSICANPFCDCSSVELDCFPEETAPASPDLHFRFWLDIEHGEAFEGEDPLSPESLEFGRAVAAELREQDWLALSGYASEAKERQRESQFGKGGVLPVEVLNGEESMVAYADVFPRAGMFDFQIGSDSWFVEDEYCLDPECGCTEVFLRFMKEEEPEGSIPEPPAAYYDYKLVKIFPDCEPAGQPALRTLVRALRRANPGLDPRLSKRHRQMRDLYRQAVQEKPDKESGNLCPEPAADFDAAPPAAKAKAKAGRNDPCPCGSGKKYKKCCGR